MIGELTLLVWSPLVLAWTLFAAARAHTLAGDFTRGYQPAARAVVAGASPYPVHLAAALKTGFAFVYPPLSAFLLAPLALLPGGFAAWGATVLMVVSPVGLLWAVGVCDWRCYAVVLLWYPTVSAILTANLSLPLACGLALCWRWRGRPLLGGLVAGTLIALKLFVWPVLLWGIAVRRYRFTAYGVAAAVIGLAAPWAAIGFRGALAYPELIRRLAAYEGPRSHTVAALLVPLTGDWVAAEAIGLTVGAVVLAASLTLGRRGWERVSFGGVIASVLLLTPVVWLHYLVLLAVVLGLAYRRFTFAWAVPLALWIFVFVPGRKPGPFAVSGATWQTAVFLALAASSLALVFRDRRSGMSPRDRCRTHDSRGPHPPLLRRAATIPYRSA